MTKRKKIEEEEVVVLSEDEGEEDVVKKLRERLKESQKKCDEYLSGWQRSRADFVNARKEDDKSREEFVRFAKMEALREFLEIADNFDMAFDDKNGVPKETEWMTGIKNIRARVKKILEDNGVRSIDTSVDKDFNPEEHEAIERVSVDTEDKDNKVIEEAQKGYKMHDKVLRPARVKVGVYKN